jgi:4-amino-4-deoxy-L-arabinose transferase-like glycosyltransferase
MVARAGFPVRLALVAIAGSGLRAIYVAATSPHRFVGDPAVYQFTAKHLAAGDGYISPVKFILAGQVAPTAEHPPLFPMLLAVPIKLGLNGTTAQRFAVACTLGAAVIVLVGLLARRLAGDRAGLIAAGLAALYPTLVAADASLESEPLYGVWLLLALLAAYRLRERRDWLSAAALGAAIGLGALTRNDALLLLPLLALPLAFGGGAGRFARLGLTALVAVLLLAPWIARNWVRFDRPVLTTNYGQGLAGSNCHETYYGPDVGGFWLPCFRLEPHRNEAAWSADLARRGLSYARHHAGRVPVVVVARVARGLGFYAPREQLNVYDMPRRLHTPGIVVYYALLVLAALGVWLLRRMRGPTIWPLLVPLASSVLVLAFYSGIVRYRHGLELMLVVLGGIALDRLLRAMVDWRTLRPRRARARTTTT